MALNKKILLIALGGAVGLANGFFGGGGGMLVVPILVSCLDLEQKKAHATAIAVILPVTAVSVISYFIRGSVTVNLKIIVLVSVAVTVGGLLGALLLKKVSGNALAKIFAVLMLVAGVKMLVG